MDTLVILNFIIIALIGTAWAQKRCYVCSGKFPDRDCELYPQYVTMGPGKVNCTMKYCTVIARYKPKKYLLSMSKDKKLTGTARPLTHMDFEVDSIARECENLGRGNECKTDPDDLAITCYSMCTDDLCNKGVPKPAKFTPPNRPSSQNDDELNELSYEDNEIEVISKNQKNDDLPESYADYDSMKPNGLDMGDNFPPPLMNDTEVPIKTPVDPQPPPVMDEDQTKGRGPGRRGGGGRGGQPLNSDVMEYEGQGTENGASTICQNIFVPLLTIIVSFIKA